MIKYKLVDWVLMGQRRALSQTDKDKLNTLYECHQARADTHSQPRCGLVGSDASPHTQFYIIYLLSFIFNIYHQIN